MIDIANLEVLEFAPDDPTLVVMGRKTDLKKAQIIAESIAVQGQIQIALGAPIPATWFDLPAAKLVETQQSYLIDPDSFGPQTRYGIIAGGHRWAGCRIAKKTFKMAILSQMPSALDVLKAQLAENLKRANLSAVDRALFYDQFVKAMPKGSTVEEIAESMGMNPSTLALHLAPKRIPVDLRPKCDGLGATVTCIIGKMQNVSQMEKVIDFAREGSTKEAVEKYIKQLSKKTVGRKPKYLTGKLDGLTFTIELKPGETAEQAAKRLLSILKRLRKHRNAPAESLGYAFA